MKVVAAARAVDVESLSSREEPGHGTSLHRGGIERVDRQAAAAHLGICDEELRLPLVPMQPANRAKLFAIMDELGLGA